MSDTMTLPSGAVIPLPPTPTERFNAIAKDMGAPTVQRPVSPPQFHTDANVTTFTQKDGKAPPPSQTTLPKSAPSTGNPVADFDAEMKAKGLQRTDAPAAGQPVEVDNAALEAVTRRWQELAPGLNNEATRNRFRAIYERDVASVLDGRKLGESITAFYQRIGKPLPKLAGQLKSDADSLMQPAKAGKSAPVTATAAPSKFTAEQWEKGHESVCDDKGYMPLDRANVAGLSGYTLPRLIDGQTVHKSVFVQLADARAAGMTQAQVTAYLTAQMRRDGWIK